MKTYDPHHSNKIDIPKDPRKDKFSPKDKAGMIIKGMSAIGSVVGCVDSYINLMQEKEKTKQVWLETNADIINSNNSLKSKILEYDNASKESDERKANIIIKSRIVDDAIKTNILLRNEIEKTLKSDLLTCDERSVLGKLLESIVKNHNSLLLSGHQ